MIKRVILVFAFFLSRVTALSRSLVSPSEQVFARDSRPILLYDGVCRFCNEAVNFVLDNDAEGRVRFAALQSKAGQALLERSGRHPDDISSIVVVTKNKAYIKSHAVLKIGEVLQNRIPIAALAPLARTFLPAPLLDATYDLVAENRYYILGHRDSCRVTDDDYADRFIEDDLFV